MREAGGGGGASGGSVGGRGRRARSETERSRSSRASAPEFFDRGRPAPGGGRREAGRRPAAPEVEAAPWIDDEAPHRLTRMEDLRDVDVFDDAPDSRHRDARSDPRRDAERVGDDRIEASRDFGRAAEAADRRARAQAARARRAEADVPEEAGAETPPPTVIASGDGLIRDPAPAARRAAIDALGRVGGDAPGGDRALARKLRDAAAREAAERWAANPGGGSAPRLDESNVCLAPGGRAALSLALSLVLEPGDVVLTTDPAPPEHVEAAWAAGARLRRAAAGSKGRFALDVDALYAAAGDDARVLLLRTPLEPVGVAPPVEALRDLAALAEALDLWVVLDERGARDVFDDAPPSAATQPGMAERALIVGSPETLGLADWPIGWVMGPSAAMRDAEALRRATSDPIAEHVAHAALATLSGARGAAERRRSALKRRRGLFTRVLDAAPTGGEGPLLRVAPADAGPFVLLDGRRVARAAGLDAAALGEAVLAEAVFEECGVALYDAAAYGRATRGFLRFSLALDEDAVHEAALRLARLLVR